MLILCVFFPAENVFLEIGCKKSIVEAMVTEFVVVRYQYHGEQAFPLLDAEIGADIESVASVVFVSFAFWHKL